jgi:hypothetical protein
VNPWFPREPPPFERTFGTSPPAPRMSAPATQRDRAPGLHFPGFGEVAQLVEHTAENRGVAGSIPALAIQSRHRFAGAC